ncbi:MAG: sensor histidine kinase [Candidatus Promineifilaceae bacterium]
MPSSTSLAVKLSAGFVLIGIIGAILVALISWRQTTQAFDRFVNNIDQNEVVVSLATAYKQQGNWNFLDGKAADAFSVFRRDGLFVLDSEQRIQFGLGRARNGEIFNYRGEYEQTPIVVDGEEVGSLVQLQDVRRGAARSNPERAFLRNVSRASIISALTAGAIALVLGVVLSRTLMRPIQELTAATQTIAEGKLGAQVVVRSGDEIGRLAQSFNKMSSDLATASQARKQMTADIAHDLRTPLSVLKGYTEGLKDGALQGDETVYGVMYDEVEHLEHLVNDLRTLSLADAGELTLNQRAVDPKALLERTGLAYVMQAEQKGIVLRVESAENLPSIKVDLERMTQVLNNLVSNALRYTKKGEVVLAAQQDATTNQSILSVRDTGNGIAANDLPHVFNRFYRADKSRQRENGGRAASSGLGLAIASAIVKAHGGTIAVQSEPQQGTTFSIHLPQGNGEIIMSGNV